MRHFRLTLAIVAVAIGSLAFAVPNQAQADIILVLTDGTPADTQTLTSTTNQLVQNISIGNYTVDINVVSTNFPGGNPGTLITNLTVYTGNGTPQTLTANAYVTTDTTSTANLATFTAPTGTSLTLSNTLTLNQGTATSGTATVNSYASGVGIGATSTSTTASTSISPATSATFNGPNGYQLHNEVILSGLANNVSNVAVTGRSAVTATPEPSTIATAMLGMALIGGYRLRRRAK